jgi:GNAT superfamily N-acetyltransferase
VPSWHTAAVIEIRPTVAEDWAQLRAVRLAALLDAPSAFESTYATESGFDESTWRHRAGTDGHFLALDGGEPVGLAAGLWFDHLPPDERHLVGMWVAPRVRGQGVAARLTAAVATWAAAVGAARLSLWVVVGNEAARRSYLKSGFQATGIVQPVKGPGPARQEERMVLRLAAEATNRP